MAGAVLVLAPSVSGLGRTPTTPENREEVGAPPHWQPIPLRSIGCQCGGPMPRADFYRRIFTLPFEVKHKDAPRLSKGLLAALEILKLDDFKVIYPGTMCYALHEKNEVVPLEQWLCEKLAGDEG
jgi:hypothetical protein